MNARNDPFVPHKSLPGAHEVSASVTLWQPEEGGHVGFPQALGAWPGAAHVRAMPMAVCEFLAQHLPSSAFKMPAEQ
jgi:predicted alpha/beta-fold hydrolase